jgi:hypothetical protein
MLVFIAKNCFVDDEYFVCWTGFVQKGPEREVPSLTIWLASDKVINGFEELLFCVIIVVW